MGFHRVIQQRRNHEEGVESVRCGADAAFQIYVGAMDGTQLSLIRGNTMTFHHLRI